MSVGKLSKGLSVAAAILCLHAPARGADSPPYFSDRTQDAGLDFVHVNGMSGKLYILEIIGAGGALFDYDNDGDLDLYVVQGGPLGPGSPAGTTDRLYRNDLTVATDGTRTVRFVDVTARSGITGTGYGMGAATGDYDNDGWVDLYVTNYGQNQLLHNNHDGSFTNVTPKTGMRQDDARWSTAATFFDYDRDGWLDLFVGTYLDFTYANHIVCQARSSAPDYCGPQKYRGMPSRLFRNRGNGTFEDVTAAAGMASTPGKVLGVVAFDADQDGWPDLYVANDGEPNFLWMNQAGRGFKDEALLAGAAVNRQGQPEGSMGVDAADVDGDGDDDLFMTNITNEKNTLFLSLRSERRETLFDDRSMESGLGAPSLPFTGFGTLFVDVDNDGWLDLPVVNGAVYTIEEQARARDPFPLRQRKQLFRNLGKGAFADVSAQAGPAFQVEAVSRGLAAGDIDNDGDTDLVVFDNNGPVRLYQNDVGSRQGWIGLRLTRGTADLGTSARGTAERDALGARVLVELEDGRKLWRRAHTDGSYLAASDARVLVGLGAAGRVRLVRVVWPEGTTEEWSALESGRYHTLRRGTGRAAR